jgi:hypothetical protein
VSERASERRDRSWSAAAAADPATKPNSPYQYLFLLFECFFVVVFVVVGGVIDDDCHDPPRRTK